MNAEGWRSRHPDDEPSTILGLPRPLANPRPGSASPDTRQGKMPSIPLYHEKGKSVPPQFSKNTQTRCSNRCLWQTSGCWWTLFAALWGRMRTIVALRSAGGLAHLTIHVIGCRMLRVHAAEVRAAARAWARQGFLWISGWPRGDTRHRHSVQGGSNTCQHSMVSSRSCSGA